MSSARESLSSGANQFSCGSLDAFCTGFGKAWKTIIWSIPRPLTLVMLTIECLRCWPVGSHTTRDLSREVWNWQGDPQSRGGFQRHMWLICACMGSAVWHSWKVRVILSEASTCSTNPKRWLKTSRRCLRFIPKEDGARWRLCLQPWRTRSATSNFGPANRAPRVLDRVATPSSGTAAA